MCTSNEYAHAGTDDEGESDTVHSSGPSLEVDSDDRDSALGDNQSTYTMSATSSVYNFRYENGRRYHAYAEGKYPLPNDEIEKDRLDLQHQAFRLTLDGKLYCAPLRENIQHVLDIGCGTGIWTIEFADDHPSATVIGTDLSPIQPTSVPPNCSFLIDDADADWMFRNKFDYIHTRALVVAIKDWDRLFQQSYANLKPGGYLECQEVSFPVRCMDASLTPETSPILRWGSLLLEAAAKTGLDGMAPISFSSKLRAAGFVDIQRKNFKWPIGKWAKGAKNKLLGYYVFEDFMDFLPGSVLGLFTRVLKWSREEVELFLAECRREIKEENKRHFYVNLYLWVARKPEDATTAGYDYRDNDDEVSLEADDASQGSAVQDDQTFEVEPTAGAARVSSHGTLIDPTADLSLNSPSPPQTMESSPSPPPTASETRKSMLSMEEVLNPTSPISATTIDDKPRVTATQSELFAPAQSSVISRETTGDMGSSPDGAEEANDREDVEALNSSLGGFGSKP